MSPSRSVFVAPLAILLAAGVACAEVTTLTVRVLDPDRDRTVRVDVAYPAGSSPDTRWPVVIVSHSGGSSGDRMENLLRRLAEAGYVALAPTHEDAAIGSGGGGRDRNSTAPVAAGLALWDSRAQDLNCLLKADWATLVPPLAGRIDTQRVAVVGHALGASTALLLGGARPVWNKQERDLRHAEVKAIVLLAPQPIPATGAGPQGLTERSYATAQLPVLVVAEADNRPATTQPSRPDLLRLLPEGDKFLLTLRGAGAMSWVTTGRASTGRPDPNARASAFEDAACKVMLAFLDSYLKADPEARDLLVSGSVVANVRDIASLEGR